jgi:Ca2+-binding RTX toxin-like protein
LSSTTRRLTAFGAALALTAAAPAAAEAATLTNSGGTLTYTAGPGTTSGVGFTQNGTTVTVTRGVFGGPDDDPIDTSTCTPAGPPNTYDCADVTNVVADGGDGNDGLYADGVDVPVALTGGDGADYLGGGAAADVLSGGAGNDGVTGGAGADALYGGSGDDNLSTDSGADVVSGGSGLDNVFVSSLVLEPGGSSPLPVSVTLDKTANDGVPGQGANVGDDVEDLAASSVYVPLAPPAQFGGVAVTGNAGPNTLNGGFEGTGADSITGGAGNDRLQGFGGDDTLNARDGFADVVSCGDGNDTAIVDTLDAVSDSCENVSTADVGNAGEDKPPSVAWTAPAGAAKLPGSTGATLMVSAADDKGIAKVEFMDDDTVVCSDTLAPYTCDYKPQGGDVGRNTLTATAFDGLGQTASSVRKVVVTPFGAKSLSLRTSVKKDTRAPYSFTAGGALTRSLTVSKALNCTGSVRVTVKAGSKTLSTKTVKLSTSCSYRAKVSLSSRRGFAGNGKLRVQARFSGNDTIAAKTSSTRMVATR